MSACVQTSPDRNPGSCQTSEAWILSSAADTIYPMSDARDLANHTELSPTELAWLNARLEEYRELLQYLRDH
jgi:hypothetical protein